MSEYLFVGDINHTAISAYTFHLHFYGCAYGYLSGSIVFGVFEGFINPFETRMFPMKSACNFCRR